MERPDIAKVRERHNLLALARGFGWLVIAAVAWWISWCVVYWLFALPATMLGSIWNWSPSRATCNWAAAIACVLLAVEGVRYGKQLFDIGDYSRSLYSEAWAVGKQGLPFVGLQLGNPAGAAWIISQCLFVAPRSTVRAWTSFRDRVRMDAAQLSGADEMVVRLRGRKGYIYATDLAGDPAVLHALDRLKVVRSKVENGCLLIRLDPDYE